MNTNTISIIKIINSKSFIYLSSLSEEEYHPPAIMDGERQGLKGEIIHFAYKNFTDMVSKINHQTTFEAKKWYRDKRKMSIIRALRKASDRFWKAYLLKKGFRDGLLGFIMAVFAGFYQILTYAKYWELKQLRDER